MTLFGTINEAMFDWPWSAVHLLSGTLIGAGLSVIMRRRARRYWVVGIGLLALWELFEGALRYLDVHAHEAVAPLKSAVLGWFFAHESPANVVGDLLIGSLGLLIGRALLRTVLRRARTIEPTTKRPER